MATKKPGGASLAGGNLTELKQRILFVLGAMLVFRIGSFITIPGVDPVALEKMVQQQSGTILDMFNMFSGGALSRLSLFALGIMPYISASIIMQLLTKVHPKLETLSKEGAQGRRKITQYTRYFTLVLGTFQAIGISVALDRQGIDIGHVAGAANMAFMMPAVITLVTGTMFLMWLGEQITERGIGNGISLIIFAGIVAGLPSALGGTLNLASTGELSHGIVLLLVMLVFAVIAFVILMERAQRRITVNYAQRQQGRRMMGGQSTHLPLKINMAGVIPPIFASAIILFPATIAGWFGNDSSLGWLTDIKTWLSPGQPIYVITYAIGIIFFCYFYTALMYNPKEVADNLKKSGAFVPGIRPGEQTAKYIDGILGRLTFIGAMYITAVCLLPEFLILKWNVPFYFGGTSILIIVVVVIDFMSQVQAHMMSHQYEGLMKKANFKNQGRPGSPR